MNPFLLFVVSILFLHKTGAFLIRTPSIQKRESMTRLSLLLLSPEEDDPNRKKKIDILSQPNPFSEFQPRQDSDNPLYTVFWKKCPECTKLLEDMEARGLRVVFIDGQAIFDIIWDEPIVYKNEEILLGWFSGNQGSPDAPPFQ